MPTWLKDSGSLDQRNSFLFWTSLTCPKTPCLQGNSRSVMSRLRWDAFFVWLWFLWFYVQSSGAVVSTVPTAEGSGIRSETRIDSSHVFPLVPLPSYGKLPRCHEGRGIVRTHTHAAVMMMRGDVLMCFCVCTTASQQSGRVSFCRQPEFECVEAVIHQTSAPVQVTFNLSHNHPHRFTLTISAWCLTHLSSLFSLLLDHLLKSWKTLSPKVRNRLVHTKAWNQILFLCSSVVCFLFGV